MVQGFGKNITDFSASLDYKFIAIASENGTFRIYSIDKIFEENDVFYYYKCEKYYPSAISISKTGKKVIIARAEDQRIIIFKLHPKGK